MIEFLAFGNVSVALLTIFMVALLGACLYWTVASILNFMLNAEHENAKVKIDGVKGFKLFRKIPVLSQDIYVTKSKHYEDKWVIKSFTGETFDVADKRFHHSEYYTSRFDSEEEAKKYLMGDPQGLNIMLNLFRYLLCAVGIEIVIRLFPMAPTLNTTELLIGCVVFGVRKLSGFLWSNMGKTEKIEGRVSKLEGSSNEH